MDGGGKLNFIFRGINDLRRLSQRDIGSEIEGNCCRGELALMADRERGVRRREMSNG